MRLLNSEWMGKRTPQRIFQGARGQTAVEYLLTTLALVTVFASLYGFMQGQVRRLFVAAGIKILTSYY